MDGGRTASGSLSVVLPVCDGLTCIVLGDLRLRLGRRRCRWLQPAQAARSPPSCNLPIAKWLMHKAACGIARAACCRCTRRRSDTFRKPSGLQVVDRYGDARYAAGPAGRRAGRASGVGFIPGRKRPACFAPLTPGRGGEGSMCRWSPGSGLHAARPAVSVFSLMRCSEPSPQPSPRGRGSWKRIAAPAAAHRCTSQAIGAVSSEFARLSRQGARLVGRILRASAKARACS